MSEKLCRRCKNMLPNELFGAERRNKNGLAIYCKPCRVIQGAEQRKKKDPDKAKAWSEKLQLRESYKSVECRKCSTCRQDLPLDHFASKRDPNVLCKMCRHCIDRAQKNTDNQKSKDPVGMRESAARRAAKCRTSVVAGTPRADRIKASRLTYYSQNPEFWSAYTREYNKQYRKTNPEKISAHHRKRRALKKGAFVSDFTAAQWLEILEYFNNACAYCMCTGVKLEAEHVVPLSKGGDHTASNIVPSCGTCNRKKHDKPVWTMVNQPSSHPLRNT